MQFLDLTLETPEEDLALDEALLLSAEAGSSGECLRLWERSSPVVILGAGCKLDEEVNFLFCQARGIPVLRRASGGGTVVLGKGCLLFSLILDSEARPELSTISGSYCSIMNSVVGALNIPGLSHDGTSDLALNGKKVSGNAQQRKKRFILHHGSLLFAFDSTVVESVLKHPPREPKYREKRAHTAFLTNLPHARGDLVSRVQSIWQAYEPHPGTDAQFVKKLVDEKYGLTSWVHRR